MSDLIAIDNKKLPAKLRKLAGITDDNEWGSGLASGFPVLSIKGKNFHIRRGGEEPELVTSPKDPDSPATYVNVVVLKTHPGVAKTYFAKAYESGADDKPTCYSKNGVEPADDAEDRQAKKCAICPHNQWGSRMTEAGNKAKRCSDVKRLAVAPVGQLNDPMLLRVPPTSLKAWDNYQRALLKRGMNPTLVITRVSLDPSVEHPLLQFKAVELVDDSMADDLEQVLTDPMVETIVDSADGLEHPVSEVTSDDDDDDEEEAPKPKPKKKAARKKKVETPPPVVDEEEEADDDEEEDDDDLDDFDFDSIDFGDDDED